MKTGTMAALEGARVWAREDATDSERSLIDPSVSMILERPVILTAKFLHEYSAREWKIKVLTLT